MDDFTLSRRARMRWNTPLSEAHAGQLLDRLDLRPGSRIVDVGCGWGELLIRAVEHVEGTHGIGVDIDPVALERGRMLAEQRGVDVEFVESKADEWQGTADRALCIGSSHVLGGSAAALAALATVVPPGGRLLFGDGCWPGAVSDGARGIFGDDVLPLTELVAASRSAGWRIIHLSTADQNEWDDFEFSSRAGRQEWLLANVSDPRAAEVQDWLDTRERQYMHNYRGVLGFAYLVLAH